MAARKKAAPRTRNPIFDAFEDYAIRLAAFHEARNEAFAAQKALQEAADRLASFGIYVTSSPPRATEPALDDGGPEPGGVPPTLHADAPTVERVPVATEVAAIRNAAYEADKNADSDALAASAGHAMERLLGKMGGTPTAAPIIGHPVAETRGDPAQENRGGGPVEQKPVE